MTAKKPTVALRIVSALSGGKVMSACELRVAIGCSKTAISRYASTVAVCLNPGPAGLWVLPGYEARAIARRAEIERLAHESRRQRDCARGKAKRAAARAARVKTEAEIEDDALETYMPIRQVRVAAANAPPIQTRAVASVWQLGEVS